MICNVFILQVGRNKVNVVRYVFSMMTNSKEQDTDKPFVCPVPGCKKRYKNVNGIKYHAKHGHKKEIR